MPRKPRSRVAKGIFSFEHLSNLALGVAGLALLLDSYRTKSRVERLGGLLALANVGYSYSDKALPGVTPGVKGAALSGYRGARRLLAPRTDRAKR